jgi:hypothetical protein
VSRELDRVLAVWHEMIEPGEKNLQVGVRMPLLATWLGERLVTRCVQIDPEQGLTMAQVQQIVESLLPDGPVERLVGDGVPTGGPLPGETAAGARLMVVDRDAFALQLAREWMQASLPRMPIV